MSELTLLPRNYDVRGGSYGEQIIAAKYCGLPIPPWRIEGEWQHGWIIQERNLRPELVIGGDGNSYGKRKHKNFFVARQDQVDYLKSVGYKKVYAIGLPILYINKPNIKRHFDSLLVMPVHSLPDTKEDGNLNDYVGYIKSIAGKFSKIYICVHQSCIDKNNKWINEFIKAGFEIIEGAEEKDTNSLHRMALLFSQFEFVTSNVMGSHIAYASYFGCKVSISGPPFNYKREIYESLTIYKNAPEILDILMGWHNSNYLAGQYPQFYVNPWEATINIDWAAWQLGLQCKKMAKELKNLFRWNLLGKLSRKIKSSLGYSYRFIRDFIFWLRS